MRETDLLYFLALQKVKGIGTINAKKLISHLGGAEQVFKEKTSLLKKINGIGEFTVQNLQDASVLQAAEKEVHHILKQKTDYAFYTDSVYPEKLKQCIDSPLILFYDGNISLDKQPIISIVGTRSMTTYGRDFIEHLIEEIQPYHPIIVSGFAYGVDIAAHKTAMKYGLQTLAVLAHGLDHIYPKTHKKYIGKMIENGGFFTEHWHDEQPLREHFLQRNRIIAGISDATIVVESATKGGSLVTAELANSYNREVFAVPGRVTDTYSQGCNNLIRTNRAQLLNSAKDLIYFLNWDIEKTKVKTIQPQLFVELEGVEKVVFEFLKTQGSATLDMISIENKLPIYKVSSVLLDLELRGLVKPLPGKKFEII